MSNLCSTFPSIATLALKENNALHKPLANKIMTNKYIPFWLRMKLKLVHVIEVIRLQRKLITKGKIKDLKRFYNN